MRNRHQPWFRAPRGPLISERDVKFLTKTNPMYRAKDGRPISMLEWIILRGGPDELRRNESLNADGSLKFGYNLSYTVLARTEVAPGRYVSTAWLGIDYAFFGGPPLIFETMDFPGQNHCERASTEDEALFNHEAVVATYRRAGSYLLTGVRE